MTPRLTRTAATAFIAAIVLALAPSAFAASEQGDAGDLRATAQDLGSGAVTSIMGSFTSGADVDVYRVCLSDGHSFSASTVGFTTLDTELFLFNSGGFGVYSNDDAGIGQRGSRLPAQHRFSPGAPGEYFLAISSFNRDPQSPQGEIFPDVFSQGFYPDGVVDAAGVGAAEPLTGWAGLARGPSGPYRIAVTGTQACPPPDSTAPTVSLRSPADGARVRQGAEVVVDFDCADQGGSGLASCVGTTADGALVDTGSLGEVFVSVTARDHAGNQTVVRHTVTVVDETAPAITVTTPAAGAVYALGAQVVADYACADEANGSGVATCAGTAADGALVDTATPGDKTFTVNASDNAGNPASKRVSYTVDGTAPSIALAKPLEGAVYVLGEQAVADYACQDEPGGSGVATCDGSVADGALIDTSRVGQRTFEVRTTDNAANSASKSVAYSVVYDFDGFLWPVVNSSHANRWKAGVLVPIRFSLDGYWGSSPEAAGYPRVTRCGEPDGEQASGVWKKTVLRYARHHDRYSFLWKTDKKWAGSCRQFVLMLDDGSVHSARFEFAQR